MSAETFDFEKSFLGPRSPASVLITYTSVLSTRYAANPKYESRNPKQTGVEVQNSKLQIGRFRCFFILITICFELRNPNVEFNGLSNHLVRFRQDVRRNNQSDLFGGFEIDCQLEFSRLLDW